VIRLMVDDAQKAKWYFSDLFILMQHGGITVVGMKFLKPKTLML
jgi:hypothetical protein